MRKLKTSSLAARAAAEVVVAVHDELLATVASSPLLAGAKVITRSVARAKAWPADARWERLMSLHRPGDVTDRPPEVLQPPISGFVDTAAVAAPACGN